MLQGSETGVFESDILIVLFVALYILRSRLRAFARIPDASAELNFYRARCSVFTKFTPRDIKKRGDYLRCVFIMHTFEITTSLNYAKVTECSSFMNYVLAVRLFATAEKDAFDTFGKKRVML